MTNPAGGRSLGREETARSRKDAVYKYAPPEAQKMGAGGIRPAPVTLPILCAQEACSWRAGLKGISQWGLHRPSPSYPLPSNDTRITVEKALLQPSSKTKSRTITHLPPACLSPSAVSLQTPPVRVQVGAMAPHLGCRWQARSTGFWAGPFALGFGTVEPSPSRAEGVEEPGFWVPQSMIPTFSVGRGSRLQKAG